MNQDELNELLSMLGIGAMVGSFLFICWHLRKDLKAPEATPLRKALLSSESMSKEMEL